MDPREPGRARGINRRRAGCPESGHVRFGGRLPGKGPGSSSMNTGPRRAAHPTRSNDLPGRAVTPSAGERGAGDGRFKEREVCVMQNAGTVLNVLRERGRRSLPCTELYRQLFNPSLYELAWGRIYANHGAMTPGADGETADGMSLAKTGRIIGALRHERYRFQPVKRVYIPKKSGKLRPLGLPSWSDKLVGEVVRLLLEAYYEPQFSGRSYGFLPARGSHAPLPHLAVTCTEP